MKSRILTTVVAALVIVSAASVANARPWNTKTHGVQPEVKSTQLKPVSERHVIGADSTLVKSLYRNLTSKSHGVQPELKSARITKRDVDSATRHNLANDLGGHSHSKTHGVQPEMKSSRF